MGVFHLSGLGLNPGVVTVPLTYIYFLLRQSKRGDPDAKDFFIHSGEAGEQLKGKPEALIVFTSKDVIEGARQNDITDNLFRTKKQKSALLTIMEYLSNLIEEMELRDDTFGEYALRYLYAIAVDINNFEDCYKKIYLTLAGLQDKEVACNLIGGANQINICLMLASSITGVASQLYYVFETDNKLMHPSPITKTSQKIPVPLQNWYAIPPLFVSMGDIIKALNSEGITERTLNIRQVESILERVGFSKRFLAKLRGTWLIIEREEVSAGPLFKNTLELHRKLEKEATCIGNFSDWRRYFGEKGWLNKFIEDGRSVIKVRRQIPIDK